MSHINSIGAGMFSDMSIAVPTTDLTPAQLAALDEAGYKDLFAVEIESVGGAKGAATDTVGGAASMGTVQNSQYYWYGKVEALQVNPQLTDSNTATITLSLQSDFFGAYTI